MISYFLFFARYMRVTMTSYLFFGGDSKLIIRNQPRDLIDGKTEKFIRAHHFAVTIIILSSPVTPASAVGSSQKKTYTKMYYIPSDYNCETYIIQKSLDDRCNMETCISKQSLQSIVNVSTLWLNKFNSSNATQTAV